MPISAHDPCHGRRRPRGDGRVGPTPQRPGRPKLGEDSVQGRKEGTGERGRSRERDLMTVDAR